MWRSALISGGALFVYVFVTSVAMTVCVPFELVFFGLLAGVLAAVFEAGRDPRTATVRGAMAGAIASIGGIVGIVAGQLIRFAFLFTPETITSLSNQLLQTVSPEMIAQGASIFVLVSCVCLNILLVPSMGALGGYLWCRFRSGADTLKPPIA